jgi:hypothetical protein
VKETNGAAKIKKRGYKQRTLPARDIGGGGFILHMGPWLGWSTKFFLREISRNIYFVFREIFFYVAKFRIAKYYGIKFFTGQDTFLNFLALQYLLKDKFYVKSPCDPVSKHLNVPLPTL